MLEKYKEYLVTINGRKDQKFITFKGLLAMAHDQNIQEITTELVSLDMENKMCIFKAVVNGRNGRYNGHGDASPRNVSKMIAPHLIRMAETRAIARALRLYTGCGYTAREELE